MHPRGQWVLVKDLRQWRRNLDCNGRIIFRQKLFDRRLRRHKTFTFLVNKKQGRWFNMQSISGLFFQSSCLYQFKVKRRWQRWRVREEQKRDTMKMWSCLSNTITSSPLMNCLRREATAIVDNRYSWFEGKSASNIEGSLSLSLNSSPKQKKRLKVTALQRLISFAFFVWQERRGSLSFLSCS